MDSWAYSNNVQLDFVQPGKPTDNTFIESFNGKLRDELRNAQVFCSLLDAQENLEQRRIDYNSRRPHKSLNYLTLDEFVKAQETKKLNLPVVQFSGCTHLP
jgi:putative transposase